MNRDVRTRSRLVAACVAAALSSVLLAPAGAQAAQTGTAIEILSYGYEQGSYSLVSGRLVTTRECRRNRTVKYFLDQEGDNTFRLTDIGLSTRKGAFGLIAKLGGDPNLGVVKIVAEPKKVGNTRCGRAVAFGD